MTGDREERNRVLGFPVGRHPGARPAQQPRQSPPPGDATRRRQGGEPQRVLGFPVDWFEQFSAGVLRPLLRRIRGPGDRG